MIKVDSLSKMFKLYRSPADRLKEIVTRNKYHTDFQALSNVSFAVADGETLGIIGQNGAGKSTLLKILTGILLPDNGTISIDGKITGLLELGTGFNAEMTGIENIYMNGTLLGMSREELDQKKEMVIDFTELGDFIYEQLKTYSSGMVMRLAFSIAIHADPKCFVVDEALSVGDAYFQQKCMHKLKNFRENGGSIIFVSHDLIAVKTLCDSALLLDKGRIIDSGMPSAIADYYTGIILRKADQRGESLENGSGNQKKRAHAQIDSGDIDFVSLKVYDDKNREISDIISEEIVKVVYEFTALKDIDDPHYGVSIRNKFGVSIFNTNTYSMNIKNRTLKKGEKERVSFEICLNLHPGHYSVSIGIVNQGYGDGLFEEYLLHLVDVHMIEVRENPKVIRYGGYFNMHPKVETSKIRMSPQVLTVDFNNDDEH